MGKIGFVGLGKLGLPVALAIESKGHEVVGYDINPAVARYISEKHIPFTEEGIQVYLDSTKLKMVPNISDVVAHSEIVFVPIQTPHDPKYEGASRIPKTRADFDYTYLKDAIKEIADQASKLKKVVTVAVISTCLPGTFEREIKPLLNEYIDYVYTPQFIAMGTTIYDYLYPEFNLIGVENVSAADKLETFYKTINESPCVKTDIITAEGIKVSYNTWITAKTVLANAWGEMSHKLGMNFDDIKKAWDLSYRRLLSAKYMDSGVGDGGGCHPRDNIALSYIADKIGMSHNIWEDLMEAREKHMEFIADEALKYGTSITVLGRSFKPETNIETGSPSVLMANILREKGAKVNHVEDLNETNHVYDAVVVIGTRHQRYAEYDFPPGTTVVDPFRYVPEQGGVNIVSVGARIRPWTNPRLPRS